MADNAIPQTSKELITLGGDMTAGLTKLGTTLKITQLTPAELATVLAGFIAAEGTYIALRGGRNAIYATFHGAEDALTKWLAAVQNVLRTHFGARYSQDWALAGFTNNTTALPTRIADRLALAQLAVQFLTSHPEYQVATLEVTPARGTALYSTANNAYAAAGENDVQLKQQDEARSTARAALVGLMTKLIAFLRGTLNKEDPRWLEFGLQIPATSSTPAAPANLQASRAEGGTIALTCERPALAAGFRWRMRVLGRDADFVRIGRSSDPTLVIADPAPEATLEFVVQAVNKTRTSVPSAPAVLLPVGTAKGAVAKTPALEVEEASVALGNGVNGHGSCNGHGTNGNGRQARAA